VTAHAADDPLLQQFLNQAQLISQLRHDLDALAHEATDAVAGLMSRVEDLESLPIGISRQPRSWCWRSIGPHGEEELWRELTDWVAWVRSRYPLARKIPGCWAEHPEIVEELTALWLAWQHAYEDPDAPLTAASDWHDRWLPGVLHRLEHGAFALDCTNQHHPRPTTAYAESGQNGGALLVKTGAEPS
jgi:hypothetical protein